MVPATVTWLPELPLSANGKVDRAALPAPSDEPRAAFVPARTTIERALASIWGEVLDRRRIGVHDNFFDLGGHSLKALQLTSLVRNRLDRELPLRSVFERPVLADMAAAIGAQE
jgi:hypothetical protein